MSSSSGKLLEPKNDEANFEFVAYVKRGGRVWLSAELVKLSIGSIEGKVESFGEGEYVIGMILPLLNVCFPVCRLAYLRRTAIARIHRFLSSSVSARS